MEVRDVMVKVAKAAAWAGMVWGMVSPAVEACGQVVRTFRASAGPIGGGGPGAMISTRSLEEYADLLGLSADQRESARTLHEGYREAMSSYQEEMRTKIEELQEKADDTGDMSFFRDEMPQMMREQTETSMGMNKRFLEDFKATLEPAQAEKWGMVERQRRRETMLMGGFYSGGGVDLVSVARREKLDAGLSSEASRDWHGAMDEYEQDMDRVLADFERVRAELRKQQGGPAMVVIADNDGVQADPRMKTMAEYSMKIRDLNDRYVARLGQVLDDAGRERLEVAYGKRAFGRVYGKAHTADVLASARGMDDLSGSKREKVAELAARYEARSRALNRQWMQAQRKLEEATGGMDFGAMNIRLGSEAKEPEDAAGKARKAVREAAAARRELDRATEQEVRAMLSKEQQSRLPEKKERQDGEWEMHGGVEVEIEEGE